MGELPFSVFIVACLFFLNGFASLLYLFKAGSVFTSGSRHRATGFGQHAESSPGLSLPIWDTGVVKSALQNGPEGKWDKTGAGSSSVPRT